MTVSEIKKRVKQKKRLSQHLTRQLSRPLDEATKKLKLRLNHDTNQERLHLENLLRGMS